MAGKNQYFRLLAIDKALQTGRKYNWKMLANILEEAVGVVQRPSERTIRGDIKILKDQLNAPIPKRCPEGLWFYSDTSFSIKNNPLFIQDVMALSQVKNVLDQFPELTFAKALEEIIKKLQNSMSVDPIHAPNVIQFEKPKIIKGTEYIEQLYNAILKQKALEIHYHPFTKPKAKKIVVHPYFLKQYNYRWFFIGWETDTEMLRVYGLERIKKIKILDIPFIENNSIQTDQYFNDVIGVSIPLEIHPQKVQLKITAQRAPYLVTKPLHPSQKTIKTLADGAIIIELFVIPNFELKAQILSHGIGIKALKPKSLVKSIQEELQQTFLQY